MTEKRRICPAIVVEGKYDKIRLDAVVDAVILVTDGFQIYRRPDQMDLLRHYAETTGLVILTDADAAGFQIRGYIKGAIQKGKLYHVYIPGIHGKERRKRLASSEGLLGVDYLPAAYLGSQLVSGVNHAFLCRATTVYPGAQPRWVIVYLYENLEGEVSVTDIVDL